MKARGHVTLYTYRATVCFCLLAIRKMINDAKNEVELSAHPVVARATEWSETRPAFHAVFRHVGVLVLVLVLVVIVVVVVVIRGIPGNFTIFSPSFVETTCDDVEHTWREQVHQKSAVPPHGGKAWAINGCRLSSAQNIN